MTPPATPPPATPPSATPPAQPPTNSPTTTVSFTETAADIANPERGFYVGLDLVNGASGAASARSAGHTLAIALVRLDAYRNAAIDAGLLASLDNGFAAVRAAGLKVILRFEYNSSAGADAPRAIILGHISQLAPVLARNADVIAVMQAGFIGQWGEWHDSTNGLDNDADRGAILKAILAALPASRGVQIRVPMMKAGIFGGAALTPAEAWSGSEKSRVGHHNDCFLSSPTDFGTYASPASTWESYVSQDGRFTAIGGETCAVSAPRSDCPAATAEMATNHWSFLNQEYNQSVLGGWSTQGCMTAVQKNLGYRFALSRATFTTAVAPGGELDVSLDLANRGYAAPFNRRPVYVVLSSGTTRLVSAVQGVDARQWAGASATVSGRFRLPAGLAVGSYSLSLWLPDDAASLRSDPRYAVRLANDNLWNATSGDNVVGQLSVTRAAAGVIDATATGFVQL